MASVLPSDTMVHVLYGSQTGCAKSIAEQIHTKLAGIGFNVGDAARPLNDYKKIGLEEARCIICVISTTGNGDQPNSSDRAWRFIRRRTNPEDMFANLHFSVLALGDTNYTKFCNAGKNFYNKFIKLGATPFVPLACADDVEGLELTVEPWKTAVFSGLETLLGRKAKPEVSRLRAGSGTALKLPQASEMNDAIIAKLRGPPEPSPVHLRPDAAAVMHRITASHNRMSKKPPTTPATVSPTLPETKHWKTWAIDAVPIPVKSGIQSYEEVLPFASSADGCDAESVALTKRVPKLRPCLLQIAAADAIEEGGDEDTAMSGAGEGAGAGASSPPRTPRSRVAGTPAPVADTKGTSAETAVTVKVVAAKYLTTAASTRRIVHMELDLSGVAFSWKVGDALGVVCPNDPHEVDTLIRRLGGEPRAVVVLSPAASKTKKPAKRGAYGLFANHPGAVVLRDVVASTVDINSPPKKAVLRLLAEHCTSQIDADRLSFLSSIGGKEAYNSFVGAQRLSVLDVLALFPSSQPPLEHLLSLLPPLQPRMYSIASSPLHTPGRAAIAFTVVAYRSGPEATIRRRGLCSNFLEHVCTPLLGERALAHVWSSQPGRSALQQDQQLRIFHRPTTDFTLPGNQTWPLIMIGPGTGVAPFIGFLQQRAALTQRNEASRNAVCSGAWRQGVEFDDLEEDPEYDSPASAGPVHLFFGNRRRDCDYLFEEELEGFASSGIITKLHLAFSREQAFKVYVQHKMREAGEQLARLILHKGAYVFVCGDGQNMARDVHQCLLDIIMVNGGKSAEEAQAVIKAMEQRGRYVKDVWS